MVGGDGTPYSAVSHCEFVDVDLNIPHDADPVYCSAEGLDAEELDAEE